MGEGARFGLAGFDLAGLCFVGLGWVGLGWVGLCCVRGFARMKGPKSWVGVSYGVVGWAIAERGCRISTGSGRVAWDETGVR